MCLRLLLCCVVLCFYNNVFSVIYYNIDIKYFKRDLTIHTEPFEDDVDDDEDEDQFRNVMEQTAEAELTMTRNFLSEINQRMMFIENQMKNNKDGGNSGSGSGSGGGGDSNKPFTSHALHQMGESCQSEISVVHDYDASDLDASALLGRSTRGMRQQQQAPRYESRIFSELSTTGGGGYSPAMNMSMKGNIKNNRRKGKRLRHVPSVHVLR